MAEGSSAIEVTAKHSPLAFLLNFTKPAVTIDGTSHAAGWSANRFDVTPGEHTVAVSFKYLHMKEAGKNSITVDVPAGATVKVAYSAPLMVTSKGKIALG